MGHTTYSSTYTLIHKHHTHTHIGFDILFVWNWTLQTQAGKTDTKFPWIDANKWMNQVRPYMCMRICFILHKLCCRCMKHPSCVHQPNLVISYVLCIPFISFHFISIFARCLLQPSGRGKNEFKTVHSCNKLPWWWGFYFSTSNYCYMFCLFNRRFVPWHSAFQLNYHIDLSPMLQYLQIVIIIICEIAEFVRLFRFTKCWSLPNVQPIFYHFFWLVVLGRSMK